MYRKNKEYTLGHAGTKLAVPDAAGITLQILQGLEELHSRNIVHNCLKPSNVLLDLLRQDAVLSDFGVSSFLQQLPHMPPSKALIHYMCVAEPPVEDFFVFDWACIAMCVYEHAHQEKFP